MDPEVQRVVYQHAIESPEFALKVAEHGFGRPPQSLDVKVDQKNQEQYIAVFADGENVGLATALPVPKGPPN